MKKILLMTFLSISLLYVSAMAVPFSLSLSNAQASLGLQATPLSISFGYPDSSVEFGKVPYLSVDIQEATPVLGIEANWDFYGNGNMTFTAGGRSEFGELKDRLNDGKISETGRLFLTLGSRLELQNLSVSLKYMRFYSSVNYNSSENMVFLAPPNYLGEPPNTVLFFSSYGFDWFKDITVEVFAGATLGFSDGFVLATPSLEAGVSFKMTTETLQSIFKSN